MASALRRLQILSLSLLFASAAHAQMTQMEGVVKDENGQPLKDAVIRIERTDIKQNWSLKTKKKGDFLHAGLPLGTYNVTVNVNGQDADKVQNVRTRMGEPTTVNFDLQKMKQQQASQQKAIETGTVTQEMARDMSPEQKAALEKKLKEQQAQMAKNKELNDAFNGGMQAKEAKDYQVAADSFAKAAALAPPESTSLPTIYGQLAESYSLLSGTKTGPEKDAALAKAIEAYQKNITLTPNDAGLKNNLAIVLAKAGKMDEMEAQLNQAVQQDPTNAGRYYFNLGAVLTNSGKQDAACNAFKKAFESDANYADAHFQYGICLTGKATSKADGTLSFPEGTAEAFQKYLELKPDGPNAEAATAMLTTMGSKIDTKYEAPGSKKAPGAKPAPAKKK